MRIERIDHLVLTVQNISISCDFYSRVLGMEVVTSAKAGKHSYSAPKRSTCMSKAENLSQRLLTQRRVQLICVSLLPCQFQRYWLI